MPVTTATADDVSSNKLKAGDGKNSIGGEEKYDYILYDGKFYRANAGTVAFGKAYLHLDSDPTASGARELAILFEEESTGISTTLMNNEKVNSEVYNLNGQRVVNPTKGLYIVNGKKVAIK